MAVAFSAKSSPLGILITGMLYGNQTHKAYMRLWQWATSGSFAEVIFTVCLMLYALHPIQILPMVQNILPGCNPRIHVIYAKAETATKLFSPSKLQSCLLRLTFMRPGN